MPDLFAYGTLNEPQIQRAVFGRIIPGSPDALGGYKKETIDIQGQRYQAAGPDEQGSVDGFVLSLSGDELRAADDYETFAYDKVSVTLESGRAALVYVKRG